MSWPCWQALPVPLSPTRPGWWLRPRCPGCSLVSPSIPRWREPSPWTGPTAGSVWPTKEASSGRTSSPELSVRSSVLGEFPQISSLINNFKMWLGYLCSDVLGRDRSHCAHSVYSRNTLNYVYPFNTLEAKIRFRKIQDNISIYICYILI